MRLANVVGALALLLGLSVLLGVAGGLVGSVMLDELGWFR